MADLLRGMGVALLIGIGIGLAMPGCGEGNDEEVSTSEQAESAGTTALEPPGGKYNGGQTDPIFYFYFQNEGAARKAGTTLREKGYKTRVTAPNDQILEWSVVAEGTPNTIDVSTAEDSMRPWAEALGGEYDGNEIPIG